MEVYIKITIILIIALTSGIFFRLGILLIEKIFKLNNHISFIIFDFSKNNKE